MFQEFKTQLYRSIQAIKQRFWLGLITLFCLGIIVSCQGAANIQSAPQAPSEPTTVREVPQLTRKEFEIPPRVNRDRLTAHLATLATERHTEAQRHIARDYIKTQLTQNNWEVEEQPFPGGINLIAHQPNQTPQNDTILVGAHYDSIRGTPGADDNATGISALLELSQIFQTYQAPKSLILAFFDLEEEGAIGSSAFTNEARNQSSLEGAIILEMLGYTCHTPNCQGIPPELDVQLPSDQGDFLSVIGDQEHDYLLKAFEAQETVDLKLFSLKVPFKGLLTPILLRSDHAPFWLKGIGAVMVSDTAFLRNPHYHRASDTVSTLNLDFLVQSTNLVARATADLLNQPPNLDQSP